MKTYYKRTIRVLKISLDGETSKGPEDGMDHVLIYERGKTGRLGRGRLVPNKI